MKLAQLVIVGEFIDELQNFRLDELLYDFLAWQEVAP